MSATLQYDPDHLVCPNCLELLTREDLEGFGRCPYCDHPFEFEGELEDFLLKPVIQYWVRHMREETEGRDQLM